MHFLLAPQGATGHITPFLPLASALLARSHTVTILTDPSFRTLIDSTGAIFIPTQHTPTFVDLPPVPDPGTTGLSAAVSVLRRLFVDRIPGQVADYRAACSAADPPVDVLVVDMCSLGAHAFRELGGPPYATLGINPLVTFDPEIPPWGSGWQPPRTWVGRWLNWAQHVVGLWVFMPRVTALLEVQRRALGLPPLPSGEGFHSITRSTRLHIMPTTEAFEFPRQGLEPQIKFVGPLLPPLVGKPELPRWWADLEGKDVVHVTQGTYATDAANLIRPTIDALADMDLILVVTSPDADTTLTQVPHNVRVANFIPHALLLPRTKAMVTNAGYNGVLAALAHGIPLVCAGRTEDKADVSARVAWCGAGIDLRTDKPSVSSIQRAVKEVLRVSHYKERAQAVKEDFKKHDSASEACNLLENINQT